MNIDYLDGGIGGGFKDTSKLEEDKIFPDRLFHIQLATRCVKVPVKWRNLNLGDAFVMDAGEVIYAWFGTSTYDFEKNQAVIMPHNLEENTINVKRSQELAMFKLCDNDNEFLIDSIPSEKARLKREDTPLIDINTYIFFWAGR